MNLTLAVCAVWMQGEMHLPATGLATGSTEATSYSIDTRTLLPGALFFAVSGERFDAHAFVPVAMAAGSVAAVVSKARIASQQQAGERESSGLLDFPVIAVDDPLSALQRLAAAVRRQWPGTLIGLTGSAGKTTTKEMVAAVLATRYSVLKSAGNLNNHFGVPLQLLRLQPEHAYAVIEMGMSAAGEIALLASLAAPDWAVVTNVGMAHAQNFADGIEGIARAKRELVEALDPDTGIAFLNGDDVRVAAFAQTFRGRSILVTATARVTQGEDCKQPQPSLIATCVTQRGTEGLRLEVLPLVADGATVPTLQQVQLQLLGAHNATNALLALAVGLQAGVPLADGAAALAALAPGDRRGQIVAHNGATLINDCYNSNPAALSAMVQALMELPAKRRIVIAGEMLELGPDGPQLHAACGRQAAEAGVDLVVGVQGAALMLVEAAAAAGVSALFFPTAQEAGAWLAQALEPGDAVLLKGSRGVGLERALPPKLADAGSSQAPAPLS